MALPTAVLAITLVIGAAVTLPSAAFAASQTVTIQDFNFAPPSVTVNVGESVTWRNTGGESHTATSNTPGFDTGVLNPGASKTIVFGTAGTFDYHCAIHPSMHGSVTVVAAVATTPPPTPQPTAPPPTAPPTAPPTTAATLPPTAAPTSVATPPPTSAPTSTPSASPSPSPVATPTSTAAPIAAASPSASASVAPGRAPAPAGDAGPLPLVVGVVVLAGVAGLAYYAFRRR